MIDGRQIRAARAILGWSRVTAADSSHSALMRLESGLADTRISTLRKVVAALGEQGIGFTSSADGSMGVVLRPVVVEQ